MSVGHGKFIVINHLHDTDGKRLSAGMNELERYSIDEFDDYIALKHVNELSRRENVAATILEALYLHEFLRTKETGTQRVSRS